MYNYGAAGTNGQPDRHRRRGDEQPATKTVDPKAPVVSLLQCVDPAHPGGFVKCTLKLEEEAGFKVVLNSSSCEAHGNIFRVTAPVPGR